LDEFYNFGYLKIAIKGSEIIVNSSIQAKKSALLFACKLIFNYDTKLAISYVRIILIQINNITPCFFESLM
jgi:hypothetical protein